jgi:hypothetical protein
MEERPYGRVRTTRMLQNISEYGMHNINTGCPQIFKLINRHLQLPRSPQPRLMIPLCPVSLSASNMIVVTFFSSSRGFTQNKPHNKN